MAQLVVAVCVWVCGVWDFLYARCLHAHTLCLLKTITLFPYNGYITMCVCVAVGALVCFAFIAFGVYSDIEVVTTVLLVLFLLLLTGNVEWRLSLLATNFMFGVFVLNKRPKNTSQMPNVCLSRLYGFHVRLTLCLLYKVNTRVWPLKFFCTLKLFKSSRCSYQSVFSSTYGAGIFCGFISLKFCDFLPSTTICVVGKGNRFVYPTFFRFTDT